MAVKITRRAQTATPQFSLWPKAFSWRLQLYLRPPRRPARFLPARHGLRWQAQRDTALARTRRVDNLEASSPARKRRRRFALPAKSKTIRAPASSRGSTRFARVRVAGAGPGSSELAE